MLFRSRVALSLSSLLVSADSYRIFSRSAISPDLRLVTCFREFVISSKKLISRPKSSESRLATGDRESSGFRSPFGRPRCATMTNVQFFSNRYLMVGSEALILPSSVITPSFNGTLRSQRNKTRLPSTGHLPRSLWTLKLLTYKSNQIN